jgi:hypothetical protein
MTVEELWLDYANGVKIPRGGTQWEETRIAFFAGVFSFMQAIHRAAELAQERPDEHGAAWLQAREEECVAALHRRMAMGSKAKA